VAEPILKQDRLFPLGQRGDFRLGSRAVVGVHEVEEGPGRQFLQGLSQAGRPRRVQALEVAVETGDTQQVERLGEELGELVIGLPFRFRQRFQDGYLLTKAGRIGDEGGLGGVFLLHVRQRFSESAGGSTVRVKESWLNSCQTPFMSRRPRIHIDGVPLHIVQRGHNRGASFFDDQDRTPILAGCARSCNASTVSFMRSS